MGDARWIWSIRSTLAKVLRGACFRFAFDRNRNERYPLSGRLPWTENRDRGHRSGK